MYLDSPAASDQLNLNDCHTWDHLLIGSMKPIGKVTIFSIYAQFLLFCIVPGMRLTKIVEGGGKILSIINY